MRCPYCGKTAAPNARVCTFCGKSLKRSPSSAASTARSPSRPPASRPPVQQKNAVRRKKRRSRFLAPNERWNPKFFAVCGVLLAIIILIPILIAIAVHNHNDEPLESRTIQSFYAGSTGKTSVVFAGKKFDKAILGKVGSVSVSADGLTQAMLTEDGTLYYVTADNLAQVASGVRSYVLSADGSHLAYVQLNAPQESSTGEAQTEEETTARQSRLSDETTTEATTEYHALGGEQYLEYLDTSLFLYSGADGSAPLIANHVAPDSLSVSSSGAYVGFAVTAEDGESFEGFLFGAGVTASIGKGKVPLATSDDGLQKYYIQYDATDERWEEKLFFQSKDNEEKLGEFTDDKRLCVFFNQDLTEIVFSFTGSDGAFFHSSASAEKTKLANGYSPVLTRGARVMQNGKTKIVPVKSFLKTIFRRADGGVQYIDGKRNCLDTGVSASLLRLTTDGKTLYYLDADGQLGACTVRKSDKTVLASNVLNFDLSPDGEILYYINTENELHTLKGSKDAVAAENVYSSGAGLCVTDGGYLYFLQNYSHKGTLCYMKGTGKVHVREEIDDVHDLAADVDDNIYYRGRYDTIKGTYDLYYGKQKKYTLLFTDLG